VGWVSRLPPHAILNQAHIISHHFRLLTAHYKANQILSGLAESLNIESRSGAEDEEDKIISKEPGSGRNKAKYRAISHISTVKHYFASMHA